jgi:hypothetical protein
LTNPSSECASNIRLVAVSLAKVALTVTMPPAAGAFTTVSLKVVVTNDII